MTNATQKTNQELLKRYSELQGSIAKGMHDKSELEKSLDELQSLHAKRTEKIKAMADIYSAITNISTKQFNATSISEINEKLKNFNLESTSFTKKLQDLSENALKISTITPTTKEKVRLLKEKEQLLSEIVDSLEYKHILNHIQMHADEENAYLSRYKNQITKKEQEIHAIQDITAAQGAELENLKGNGALKAYLEKIKNYTKIEIDKLKSNKDKLPEIFRKEAEILIRNFKAKHKDFKSGIEENKDLPELLQNIQALSSIANLNINTRLKNLRDKLDELPQKVGEWDLRVITEGLLDNAEKLFNQLEIKNLSPEENKEVIEINDQLELFEKLLASKNDIQNVTKKIKELDELRKKLPENSRSSCKIFIKKIEQDIADLFRTLPDNGTIKTTIDNAIIKLNQDIEKKFNDALLVQEKIKTITELVKSPETSELSEPIKSNLKQAQELLNALSFDKENFSNQLETIAKKLEEDARLRKLAPIAAKLSPQLIALQEEIKRLATTKETEALIASAKNLLVTSEAMLRDSSKATEKGIIERTEKITKIINNIHAFYASNILETHAMLTETYDKEGCFADDIAKKLSSVITNLSKLDINNDNFNQDLYQINNTFAIIDTLQKPEVQEFAIALQKVKKEITDNPENMLINRWSNKLEAIKRGDIESDISKESYQAMKQVTEDMIDLRYARYTISISEEEINPIKQDIDAAHISINIIRQHQNKNEVLAANDELIKLNSIVLNLSPKVIKALTERQEVLTKRIELLKNFKNLLEIKDLSEDEIIGKAISIGIEWPQNAKLPEDINELKAFIGRCIDDTSLKFGKLWNDGQKINQSTANIIENLHSISVDNEQKIKEIITSSDKSVDLNLDTLEVRLTNLKDNIDFYFKGCNIFTRNFGKTAKTLKNTQAKILKALREIDKVKANAKQSIIDSDKHEDKHKLLAGYKDTEKFVSDFTKTKKAGTNLEEMATYVNNLITERTTPKK